MSSLKACLLACVGAVFLSFTTSQPAHAFDLPKPTISGLPGFTNSHAVKGTASATVDEYLEVEFICRARSGLLSVCDPDSPTICTASADVQTCSKALTFTFTPGLSRVTRTLTVHTGVCLFSDSPSCRPDEYLLSEPTLVTVVYDSLAPSSPRIERRLKPTFAKPATSRDQLRFVFKPRFPETLTFECRVDNRIVGVCTSPFLLTTFVPRNGRHNFLVRAVDQAGNVGNWATKPFAVDILKRRSCRKLSGRKRARCVRANARAKADWLRRNR